jgi:hypothetical protein
MINSHAHLDFDEVNDRHIAQNAVAIVPSVSKQNWTDVQSYPYFALGIHPWMIKLHQPQDLEHLEYAIFLTITGNVVFFSKILDTSLSENLNYIASLFIWLFVVLATILLLILDDKIASTTRPRTFGISNQM